MQEPFFSIVIPSYNRGHLVGEVIGRALDQTFGDFEIIVVDDGSTDNTREIVSSFSDTRLRYFYQDNRERAAARNKGVEIAAGRYVTFCDSDDRLFPFYLEEAMMLIKRNGEIPWLHIGYEILRSGRPVLKMNAAYFDFTGILAKGNPLSCLGVFVRKDIFMKHRFNEDRQLSGSEDWELWLRLSAHYRIICSKRTCAALVLHPDRSVIHTTELKLQLRKFLSINYALEDEVAMAVYKRHLDKMYAYFDTYIALHLVLGQNSVPAIKYVLKAFKRYPPSIFTRRMLAMIKLTFFNLFNIR